MIDEHVLIITDKAELYDKCENIEELFDKYYLPLVETHFKKTYQLQQDLKDSIAERNRLLDEIHKIGVDIGKNDFITQNVRNDNHE